MRIEEKFVLSLVRGCRKALLSKIIEAHESVWEEEADPKVSMCKGTKGEKTFTHWFKLSEHLQSVGLVLGDKDPAVNETAKSLPSRSLILKVEINNKNTNQVTI